MNADSAVETHLPRHAQARVERLSSVPFSVMKVDADQLEALAAIPEVTDIQEDRQPCTSLGQSVPVIQADEAWIAGYTGSGWAEAVLDNGVQKSHPFPAIGRGLSDMLLTRNPGAGDYSMCLGCIIKSTVSVSAPYCPDPTFTTGPFITDPTGLVSWPVRAATGFLSRCSSGTFVTKIPTPTSAIATAGYSGSSTRMMPGSRSRR